MLFLNWHLKMLPCSFKISASSAILFGSDKWSRLPQGVTTKDRAFEFLFIFSQWRLRTSSLAVRFLKEGPELGECKPRSLKAPKPEGENETLSDFRRGQRVVEIVPALGCQTNGTQVSSFDNWRESWSAPHSLFLLGTYRLFPKAGD